MMDNTGTLKETILEIRILKMHWPLLAKLRTWQSIENMIQIPQSTNTNDKKLNIFGCSKKNILYLN